MNNKGTEQTTRMMRRLVCTFAVGMQQNGRVGQASDSMTALM